MNTRKALGVVVLLVWTVLFCLPTGALADRLPSKRAEHIYAAWDPEVPDGGNEPRSALRTNHTVAVDDSPVVRSADRWARGSGLAEVYSFYATRGHQAGQSTQRGGSAPER